MFPPDQTAELSTPAGRAPARADVAAAAADSIPEGRSEVRPPPAKIGVWEEGAVIHDRYTLERRLGSGSMGEVFLASDRLLKKHIALKVLRKDLAKSRATVRRFLREVALAHSVTHPNVVRIYDTGEADGLPYFSMEHLQGQTLDELIDAGRRRDSDGNAPAMTLREIREISHEILSGLAAAHDAGIVHRDLKPANVMLTHRGAIVMDFGVAGFDTPGEGERPNPAEARSLVRTEAGTIFGSPAYMAPELWEGAPATVQSDLYSFGVMLYQMLTGRLPIEAPNAKVFLVKLREEKPIPVRQLRKDTPWNLSLLVARCMRREPEKRPVSAAAAANLVSPLVLRWRWLAGGVLTVLAITLVTLALRGPTQRRWMEYGVPDRVAVADIDAFVRSFDAGDYVAARDQLERLELRAPNSAALVFWRATLAHELGEENRRIAECEAAGYDPDSEGEGWDGNDTWRELAQRSCAANYSLAEPLRALVDPDDTSKLPDSWLPLAVSEWLVPRLDAARDPGPALSREAEYVLARLSEPYEFRDNPVLALRWQLARMEIELALGKVDEARSTLDTALDQYPGAPLAMARAAWFYTLLDDRERAESWAREVEFEDPRPSIRLLLDEGRLRDAMAWIDEYSTRPGVHPHHQALLDMWCGYAYRFQIEAAPLRCMEMSPGLVRNLWRGARNDVSDYNAMNAHERAIISQQAAINRSECLARGANTSVISLGPPSFETYLRQLDIVAALCLSGRDSGPDLELARLLADDLLAHTPADPWALLFGAQVDDQLGRVNDALTKRQRVAKRWAKADADLPLVVDLRKILGDPELPSVEAPSDPVVEIDDERVSVDEGDVP